MQSLIKIPEEIKKHLSELIIQREQLLDSGRAQCDESLTLRKRIDAILNKFNIEFCSHNFAILGSNRYKKYKYPSIDFLITNEQFKNLEKENKQ